jgi:hypothetical protein
MIGWQQVPQKIFFHFTLIYLFLSDAICFVSDHLQIDIFRLSVCNPTAVSDYVPTKVSIIRQLLLHMRLNLSCHRNGWVFNACFKFLSTVE